MKRYFIYLAYNGENYCGWQIQPNGVSVQETIEKALSTLLRTPTTIVGAGRTDAGVHARMMAAHFDYETANLDLPLLAKKLNSILPKDISIYNIVEVNPMLTHVLMQQADYTDIISLQKKILSCII